MLNLGRVVVLTVFALACSWSSEVSAASVTKCSAKTRRCIVSLDEGIVGDTVNVLNEKAQLVAVGWIIKRQGAYGVVSFKQILRSVKTGYPVIVNTTRSTSEYKWASAFGKTSDIR
jgi:hypothetical protein